MQFHVFQMLVRRWVVRAFGEQVADDRAERTHRFLEEALELAQSTECTQQQAHALVDYVYGRPQGSAAQEVGGVLITLAGLCAARGMSMDVEAAAEITRVNRPETLERIRHKHAAKKRDIPLSSPLPGQPSTLDDVSIPTDKHLQRMATGAANPTPPVTLARDGAAGRLRARLQRVAAGPHVPAL